MTRRVLVGLVVFGALAAAAVLFMRVHLEARYRAVEIVLDGDDWIGLIRREGRSITDDLRELRRRGAVSVALSDTTIKRLADEGAVSYASGGALMSEGRVAALGEPFRRLQAAGALRTGAVYVAGSPENLAFVAGRMRLLLGPARVRTLGGAIEVLGTQMDLEELGLGFRPSDAAPFRAAGLDVVLRPRNFRGLTAEGLKTLVDSYAETSPSPTLIFALTEVQGYDGLLAEAADEYKRVGARFGRIEVFTARRKQKGEDRLTALMRPSVIRVFSVTPEELQVLQPDEVADRFVRAAQERNLRLLYVRPLLNTPGGQPAMQVNLDLVETIAKTLTGFGFTTTRARPLPPLQVPTPLVWGVALGATALTMLVAGDLARAAGLALPVVWITGALILSVLGTAAAGFTRFDVLWRQLLALVVAIAGATGAAVWAFSRVRGGVSPVVQGYLMLLRALAMAVVTGMFAAALLSQWPFMLAFSTFLGVKAAHVVPVVLVAFWLVFEDQTRAGADWRTAARRVAQGMNNPLRIGAALGVLVVSAAAVALLARTGNISVPVSGPEQRLRTVLESTLVARPRTKEFLIGYPSLVLAGAAAALGWRRVAFAFVLAGAVGPAGAINSFSHAHTPFLYTVWRTGNALVVGAAVALPAVLVLRWIARRPAPL